MAFDLQLEKSKVWGYIRRRPIVSLGVAAGSMWLFLVWLPAIRFLLNADQTTEKLAAQERQMLEVSQSINQIMQSPKLTASDRIEGVLRDAQAAGFEALPGEFSVEIQSTQMTSSDLASLMVHAKNRWQAQVTRASIVRKDEGWDGSLTVSVYPNK